VSEGLVAILRLNYQATLTTQGMAYCQQHSTDLPTSETCEFLIEPESAGNSLFWSSEVRARGPFSLLEETRGLLKQACRSKPPPYTPLGKLGAG
jgi:hypothetical protein